ncbi:MAG TPA: zf-HC2 domain-containing protein [Candidatus Binatia bacterium]|jgi:anti-sigma factor RsiW
MICRDIENMLDRFLDGELEARSMRVVALHVTRCPACERLLQELERLQELIVEGVNEAVARVDFTRFWADIAGQAEVVQRSFGGVGERLRALAARPAVIAAVMAVALLVSALEIWRAGASLSAATQGPPNNQARIDSLVSDAPSVALFSEPVSNTTVIWIDEGAR